MFSLVVKKVLHLAQRSVRVPALVHYGVLFCAIAVVGSGCASLTNPVANGVPVRRLSPELLADSREDLERTPLASLRQPPPKAYKLSGGDILGIWIEGVLGERNQSPPVYGNPTSGRLPALGFPIPVRADGTISLPLVPPIRVEGRTLQETEDLIRAAYTTEKAFLKPGQERIIVTLAQPREYHVLVIRQDSPNVSNDISRNDGAGSGARTTGFSLTVGGGIRSSRRGTGFSINLPAYENDVLNALARTGGFPGSDAVDEVIVERGSGAAQLGLDGVVDKLRTAPADGGPLTTGVPGVERIRIPLRYKPGQRPQLKPEDVILQNGDIVFIEGRESDVYFTGGVLPAGEHPLPRDTDLNVIQALARAGAPILSGNINTGNVQGATTTNGLGGPSPTLVSVIRQTPGGGQVTIYVDLDLAFRDPRERLLIKPQDIVILQSRPSEAIANYFTQIFNFNLAYQFLNSSHATGAAAVILP